MKKVFIIALVLISLFLIGSINYSDDFTVQIAGKGTFLLKDRIASYEKKYSINPNDFMKKGVSEKDAQEKVKPNQAIVDKAREFAKNNCLFLEKKSNESGFSKELILGLIQAESGFNKIALSSTAANGFTQVKIYHYCREELPTVKEFGKEGVPCYKYATGNAAISVKSGKTIRKSTNTKYAGLGFGIPPEKYFETEIVVGIAIDILDKALEDFDNQKTYSRFKNCEIENKKTLALAVWNSFNNKKTGGNTCNSIKNITKENTGDWVAKILAFERIFEKATVIPETCSLVELTEPKINVVVNGNKDKPSSLSISKSNEIAGNYFTFKVINECAENYVATFKDLTGNEVSFKLSPEKQCSLKLNKPVNTYEISMISDDEKINIKQSGIGFDFDFTEAISSQVNEDTKTINVEKQPLNDREAKLFLKDCEKGNKIELYEIKENANAENEINKINEREVVLASSLAIEPENQCIASLKNIDSGIYYAILKSEKNVSENASTNELGLMHNSLLIKVPEKPVLVKVFKETNLVTLPEVEIA